jgi:hypothetical protein
MTHSMHARVSWVAWLLCMPVMPACLDETRFMMDEGGGPFVVEMTADTAPAFADGEDAFFLVERRVLFELRAPTDQDLAELQSRLQSFLADNPGAAVPFPRYPWVRLGDIEMQIDFTLTNLDSAQATVAVVVNGLNEFHEYVPGFSVVGNDVLANFSGWERTYALQAGESRAVTIRQEETREVAIDLATVVNGAPNSNLIVNRDAQSSTDPRSQPYIPPIIPSLLGVRVGLRGTEARALRLEFTLRLRDRQRKLSERGKEPWQFPAPALFEAINPDAVN